MKCNHETKAFHYSSGTDSIPAAKWGQFDFWCMWSELFWSQKDTEKQKYFLVYRSIAIEI